MPFLCEIPFDSSIHLLNRPAAYPMSETDSLDTRKDPSTRPQTRTVPKGYSLGHGDGFSEARTTLAFFRIPSHKGGQRRIHDRIPDQSFQPWCHIVLWERRLVETYFNLELLMPPNDTDDRGGIATVG